MLCDGIEHLFAAHPQLVFQMQIRGGNEGVDARCFRGFHGGGGALDVMPLTPRQRRDGTALHRACDGLHGVEIIRAGSGEAGFDHVHAQLGKLLGKEELLRRGHRAAGRLFAVTQGGVEDAYVVAHGCSPCRCCACAGR